MKEYILNKERIFHFLSLALVAGSMFIKDPLQKIIVLLTGILGLLFLSALKKQKIMIIIYFALLVIAVLYSYLFTEKHYF